MSRKLVVNYKNLVEWAKVRETVMATDAAERAARTEESRHLVLILLMIRSLLLLCSNSFSFGNFLSSIFECPAFYQTLKDVLGRCYPGNKP